ncbi:MAG: (Fe-S)-binding protein [Crenarchaeota archaeon]|nr:(Fe-S)-binding protein [Thermoproteota archaeon]MCR8501448.1 (Fe-S)-binding protein [Thermoproteota archaeon]
MLEVELRKLGEWRDEVYTCNRTRCGYCQEGCLPYKVLGFEHYSSRGRMITIRALVERKIDFSESLVDSSFNCFLCGFCDAKCALFPTNIFTALRRELFVARKIPEPIKAVVDSVAKFGNPYGLPREDRAVWAKNANIRQRGHVLFFTGCIYPYLYPKRIHAIYLLLEKIGVEAVYVPEIEGCCGYPVFLTGDWETFDAIAKANYKAWKERGIKKIVSPCPGCVYTISEIYPKFVDGFELEVTHVVMSVFEEFDRGRIKLNRLNRTFTYHDPCDLSRKLKLVEQPRKLIEALGDLIEPKYNKFFARCCGGGGIVSAYNPQLHLKASLERAQELVDTQAEIITTTCPTCYRTLDKGLKRIKAKTSLEDLNALLLDIVY